MSKKAEIINLESSQARQETNRQVELTSGRQIRVHSSENGELVEILEAGGEVVIQVRLTDGGPVVTVRGAHLELKSTETLALEAKKVRINAQEEAVVESKGTVEIGSSREMRIHSEDDIRVVGKIIHLN
jgi:hypothetical protein